MIHFTFQSYAWSLGTTSFRMAEFHKKVEEQLILLDEFWKQKENCNISWNSNSIIQTKYYKFTIEKGLVTGNLNKSDTSNMAKTAREKTSGMVDLGLLFDDRHLTPAGRHLLSIAQKGNFAPDNVFNIASDSFLYFKQLLKLSNKVQGKYVRPFLVTGKLIKSLEGYLTKEEFTYLLPLCINPKITEQIIVQIKLLRAKKTTISEIIKETVLKSYNYPAALDFLKKSEKTPDDIVIAGMNRKSPKYDLAYAALYNALAEIYIKGNKLEISKLVSALKAIRGHAGTLWRSLIFPHLGKSQPSSEDLNKTPFDDIRNEEDFVETFFIYMHLFKIMANLSDYQDLNKRYLGLSDIFLFHDETIKFTPIFDAFFNTKASASLDDAFQNCNELRDDIPLEKINKNLFINTDAILNTFNHIYAKDFSSLYQVYEDLENERNKCFQILIDAKFPNSKLIELLGDLETRNHDETLIEEAGGEADIPTIFEYLVGIAWYRISNYQGNILEYMNLSLNANLMPVTHAAGGRADIVYKYTKTQEYPAHTLLIECTLLKGINQRHSEMEPVSRHLTNYLLDKDKNAYCVFIASNLHASVISDFRARKYAPYYRNDEEFVESMKIIPMDIEDLKAILKNKIHYDALYALFDVAFHDPSFAPPKWYKEHIQIPLHSPSRTGKLIICPHS